MHIPVQGRRSQAFGTYANVFSALALVRETTRLGSLLLAKFTIEGASRPPCQGKRYKEEERERDWGAGIVSIKVPGSPQGS